jgi:hypothetical protein
VEITDPPLANSSTSSHQASNYKMEFPSILVKPPPHSSSTMVIIHNKIVYYFNEILHQKNPTKSIKDYNI